MGKSPFLQEDYLGLTEINGNSASTVREETGPGQGFL